MRPVEIGTGLHVLVPTYKFGRCTVWQFQGDGGSADRAGTRKAVVVKKKSVNIMVGVVARIANVLSVDVVEIGCVTKTSRPADCGVGQGLWADGGELSCSRLKRGG